ncbi:MAG: hypothetical protein ACKOJI_05185 [Phycisphaerales bacterium]
MIAPMDVLWPALAASGVAILATLAVERLGGRTGGILSSIPTTIVPAAIGLWDGGADPERFRRSMAFVPVGIVLNAGYLLLWRVVPARVGMLTRRHLLAWTVVVSLGAWFAAAFLVSVAHEWVAPTVDTALWIGAAAAAAGLSLAIAANRVPHPAPAGRRRVGPLVLAARGVAAGLAIGVAVALSRSGLPIASSMAAVFPAIFTTIMVATWLSQGAQVPTGAVGPMMLGTLSVSAYALLASWAFPAMHVAAAAAFCWIVATVTVSVPGFLWLRRRPLL